MPPFRLRAIFGTSEGGAPEERHKAWSIECVSLKQSTLQCFLFFQCWP